MYACARGCVSIGVCRYTFVHMCMDTSGQEATLAPMSSRDLPISVLGLHTSPGVTHMHWGYMFWGYTHALGLYTCSGVTHVHWGHTRVLGLHVCSRVTHVYWGHTCIAMLSPYLSARDLSPGPHACTVSILLTESSLPACFIVTKINELIN